MISSGSGRCAFENSDAAVVICQEILDPFQATVDRVEAFFHGVAQAVDALALVPSGDREGENDGKGNLNERLWPPVDMLNVASSGWSNLFTSLVSSTMNSTRTSLSSVSRNAGPTMATARSLASRTRSAFRAAGNISRPHPRIGMGQRASRDSAFVTPVVFRPLGAD